ncbi:MAG: DNA-binding NtrC family response regulator [Desulforhopalus sp.]|jgi:DNA-binding NtrC family response regulator
MRPNELTTILLVDDEEVLRESISDFLEDRDYKVFTAENGYTALEIFKKEKPDLILSDLRMPEMDGLELLQTIGTLSPETPLIVVSGTGRISDTIQALQFGAWDYILKPVQDMDIIIHAVEKCLERAQLQRQNKLLSAGLRNLGLGANGGAAEGEHPPCDDQRPPKKGITDHQKPLCLYRCRPVWLHSARRIRRTYGSSRRQSVSL